MNVVAKVPLLIDDGTAPEIPVTAIARMERLTGGQLCITYYLERRNAEGEMEHRVALRLLRPLETLPQALRMAARIIGEADMPFVAEGGEIKLLDS